MRERSNEASNSLLFRGRNKRGGHQEDGGLKNPRENRLYCLPLARQRSDQSPKLWKPFRLPIDPDYCISSIVPNCAKLTNRNQPSISVSPPASVTHQEGRFAIRIPSFVRTLALVSGTTWVKGQVSPLGTNISSQLMNGTRGQGDPIVGTARNRLRTEH